MTTAFQLEFHRVADPPPSYNSADSLWSLGALDPAVRLSTGSFLASDGAKVPYRLWPVENPKAIVLLLHSACDYSGAFDAIAPRFAERGLAVAAFDQRGFGATRSRQRWSGCERMVRDVADAVRFLRHRFGDRPIFLVGESMGASIAVHTAADLKTLGLSGIVLAAPGALAGSPRRLFATLICRVLNWFAPNGEFIIRDSGTQDLSATAAIRLWCDPMVLRRISASIAVGLLEMGVSAVEAASRVDIASLTMVGSKEDFLDNASISRLHDNLKGDKSWIEFDGGPHLLLHWQKADLVLSRVLDWMAERLPAPAPPPSVASQPEPTP